MQDKYAQKGFRIAYNKNYNPWEDREPEYSSQGIAYQIKYIGWTEDTTAIYSIPISRVIMYISKGTVILRF